MGQEILDTMVARLKDDEVLQDAVSQAKSVNEVVRLFGQTGSTIPPDDVQQAHAPRDLADAELEGAAGGGFTTYGCDTPTQYFVFTHCYP